MNFHTKILNTLAESFQYYEFSFCYFKGNTRTFFNFQSEGCFKAVKDTYYGSHDCYGCVYEQSILHTIAVIYLST